MKLILLSLCFGLIQCYRYNEFRPRRSSYPHHAMMFSGFYRSPNYLPPGSMTAFASPDTVATNSFSGGNMPDYLGFPIEDHLYENKHKQQQPELVDGKVVIEEEQENVEEDIVTTTIKPKRIPKRKPKPTTPAPDSDEEDEDDEEMWPLKGKGYNAFFPIIFGSRGSNSRSGGEDGGYPGSATAIANSFSTGKGGVATSHATAFGDPYLPSLLKNMRRKAISKKQD